MSSKDAPRYPKPEAITRIPEYGHAVIDASAGSGKTHTIEHFVIDLIVRGTRIEEILVVTFTERATAELKYRIRTKIAELLALESTATNLSPENCWTLDSVTRERLETARVDFDRAAISTIHGFCRSVLTENAFLNGSLFDEAHADERSLFSRAFKDVLRTELSRREELSPFLSAWLEIRQSSVVGLEELLYETARHHAPIRPEFDPSRLTSVASGFKVAVASVDELVERGVRRGSSAKVQRNLEAVVEALKHFRRAHDIAALVAELDDVDLPYLDDQLGGFAELASAAPPLATVTAQQFLPLVLERLTAIKRRDGLFDYDDLLRRVDESLDGPRGDELARVLRARYRSVLIDEFQDTDAVQWNVFRKLFFVDGAQTPMRVVGDPKQGIYGFRGADVHVYLEARSALVARATMVPLTENFRSTPALIDALNLMFDQKAETPFFTGNVHYERPLRAGRSELELVNADGDAVPPVVLVNADSRAKKKLAAHFAREIEALTTDDERALRLGMSGKQRPLGVADIFVLTRTTREAIEVGEALDARGVSYAFYKQDGLFQSREADEVRAVLAAIADISDRSKRMRAWMTRFFGLSLRDLERCRNVPPSHPLMSRLTHWKRLADAKDYERLFADILENSGVAERELFTGGDERALTNYSHILDVMLRRAHATRASLPELTRELTALIEGESMDRDSEDNVMRLVGDHNVHVMTFHMAKGLEAGIVFVYGFSAGRSRGVHTYYEGSEKRVYVGQLTNAPDKIRKAIERERLEEDQRLFYVALTRARARLYLPLLPEEGPGLGCYAQVNRRLHELLGVFAIDEVAPDNRAVEEDDVRLGDWTPPAELARADDQNAGFDRLRERHRGHVITSYSRLKTLRGGYRAPIEDAADIVEPVLPGGRTTGLFLHDVLEHVDFRSLRVHPSLDSWRGSDQVQTLMRWAMRSNGIEARFRGEAERIVHTALTSPVALGPHHLGSGFASVDNELREVEFVLPYPEADGRLGRGYAKGFVDFVFELAGMTYFCDWKSDLLPSWEASELSAHVERNYTLQAKLYTLALVEMLGVSDEKDYLARFGGLVYCFVRGMPSGGIYFDRPSWETVGAWTSALVREERL